MATKPNFVLTKHFPYDEKKKKNGRKKHVFSSNFYNAYQGVLKCRARKITFLLACSLYYNALWLIQKDASK